MADYISRDKINEAFDSIWDCADMVFEPDDHCCAADDCGRCKCLQTKNAIKKKLDCIPPDDVRPVVRGEWLAYPILDDMCYQHYSCSICKRVEAIPHGYDVKKELPFCHCGADMRRTDSSLRSE